MRRNEKDGPQREADDTHGGWSRPPAQGQSMTRLLRELLPLVSEYAAQGRVLNDEHVIADLSQLTALLVQLLGALPPDISPISQRSRVDDYIEDMIDPEFGLKPARTTIERAAEIILDSAAANIPWGDRGDPRRR